KCLQQQPTDRYGSAAELAEDLGRWLAGEPISARPVTTTERAWRWCKRNPAITALSAAVSFLLLTVAISSSVSAWRLSNEQAQTKREKKAADNARADAIREAKAANEARKSAEDERDAKQKALTRAEGLRLTAQSSAVLPSIPGLGLLLAIEGAITADRVGD